MLTVQADKRDLCATVISRTEEKPRGHLKTFESEDNFLYCLTSFKTLLKITTKQTQSTKYLDEPQEMNVSTMNLIHGSQ